MSSNSKLILGALAAAVVAGGYILWPVAPSDRKLADEEIVLGSEESPDGGYNLPPGAVEVQDDGTRIEVSEDGRTTNIFHTDGSLTTRSGDGFGSSTESKFFKDNLKVKGISVTTSPDGSRTVKVFAANGAAVLLSGGELKDPLNATVSEIAAAAGIFEEDRPAPQAEVVESVDETDDPISPEAKPTPDGN
jgi:hypothetical protein